MYNTDFPTRAELPTAAKLKRSTLIAALCAGVLLTTVVLPSEYGIDPMGFGGMVGLTEMGRIKMQLASEAAKDTRASAAPPTVAASSSTVQLDRIEGRLEQVERLLTDPVRLASIAPAAVPETTTADAETMVEQPPATVAEPTEVAVSEAPTSATASEQQGRDDEFSLTLAPGEGKEVKLIMTAGAKANFAWSASGGVVNFDTHGEGGGQSVSYQKGRGVTGDEGVLQAEFDGSHGWFWRNRTSEPVTLTLRTSGDYSEMKRPVR
uniref:Putative transmembrane anchor protein n=1 Tax=Rhizobium rhizogenes TaxID=359 RepID=A0A7S4ZUG5_RHIRH|nr:hypothetical protein [Rhizobium rhizogenes]QCL10592.1 putative transmembrane anchor protein [Rhizobium rhizogenes]